MGAFLLVLTSSVAFFAPFSPRFREGNGRGRGEEETGDGRGYGSDRGCLPAGLDGSRHQAQQGAAVLIVRRVDIHKLFTLSIHLSAHEFGSVLFIHCYFLLRSIILYLL